jgi:hypothetical protein
MKKLFITFLITVPLVAQDSTKYDREYEKELYITKRIIEARKKKENTRMIIKLATVAGISYYVGWLHGKRGNKRHYPRMYPGDKDYKK